MIEYERTSLVVLLSVLLIFGCTNAQPKKPRKQEIVNKIMEFQATPTTPENLQERALQIGRLLARLEQKRGKETLEQIVSGEKRQAFAEAMRSRDHSTACRIVDEIISNLAELAEVRTRGGQRTAGGPETTGEPKSTGVSSTKGTALPYQYFDSPFGFHSCYYDVSPYKHAVEIGVRWDRGTGLGGYLTPMPQIKKGGRANRVAVLIEIRRRIGAGVYDFSYFDRFIRQVPRGMHIVQNIAPIKKEAAPWVRFFNKSGSWLPKDKYKDYYLGFVQKTVERYDGDGIDDMPGLPTPIKYWQIANEPHYNAKLKDLAKLVKLTQPVIKRADPEARIILGGASLQPLMDKYLRQLKEYYYPILDELDGTYIDVFDFHWYGKSDGDYEKARDIYEDIRKNLDQRGYRNVEIWVTEMGTYSGAPGGKKYDWPVQTETEQAMDLLKRYVYSLSLGIEKIFWAWGMVEGFPPADDNHFYDHTGLIYDGRKLSSKDIDMGKGTKKLAYYTYKIMTDKLEGSDWDNIERIQEEDGIHIYKFRKQGEDIWVAWNDDAQEKQVVIRSLQSDRVKITEAVPRYDSGKDIRDVDAAFKVQVLPKQNDKISLNLDRIPLIIEQEPR